MKKQIVVIHGGTTFDTYGDYVSYLKSKRIKLNDLKKKSDWKNSLEKELGKNYNVLLPRMPNKANARYKEWEIWFKKILPLLGKNVVLVGHSLGGIFLAKYLSKNAVSRKIKATFLVAAPFDAEGSNESLADFVLPESLKRFSSQGGIIFLIHSKDDPIVPFEQLKKYKKALPCTKEIILDKRGHMNQEKFPELVREIKNLFK